MGAYYNEIDPYAAQWLRNLISAGHIAAGDVDTRSIKDVRADDLRGYTQCHFFAGLGGWSHALRLAGWEDDRPVWTGSCPCQPFSAAGKGGGVTDDRHLWPAWFNLIRECRPPVIFGEQVAAKAALPWFDLVSTDMEAAGYTVGASDICAAGVGAPHIRQRLWFVADAGGERTKCLSENDKDAEWDAKGGAEFGGGSKLGNTDNAGSQGRRLFSRIDGGGGQSEFSIGAAGNTFWSDADWLPCIDGKSRPVESGTFPLAHGATARVGRLRAYGNAIVPQVAQAFIEAYRSVRQ